MLVFVICATSWLEPAEDERIFAPLASIPENTDPARLERGFASAGLSVVEAIELRSEWREAQEESGAGRTSRQLLHVARLLRRRDQFVARFGEADFDIELANSLYGIYQMIGKLSTSIRKCRNV